MTGLEESGSAPAGHRITESAARTTAALAFYLWIGGGLLFLIRKLGQTAAWRRRSRPTPAPPELLELVREVGEALGVANVRVEVFQNLRTPLVAGLVRPRLLWPVQMVGTLEPARARTLIAHELAHLKHLDLWVSAAELLASCVWWWYPGWHWVRRRLRDATERACDARVVDLYPHRRRDYAEALLDALAGSTHPLLPLARGLGERRRVRKRLEAILRRSRPCPRPLAWTLGVVLLIALTPAWLSPRPAADRASGEPMSFAPGPRQTTPGPALGTRPPTSSVTPGNPNPLARRGEASSAADAEEGGVQEEVVQQVAAGDSALLDGLRSRDPRVRVSTVRKIGQQRLYEAMPWIYPLATDPEPAVRRQVASSIGLAEPNSGLPILLRLLQDEDPETRRSAAWGLGEYEPDQLLAASALPALADVSRDPDASVRRQVAASLSITEIDGAVPILLGLLEDGSAAVRATAVWGLGDLRRAELTTRIVPLAGDPDPGVRQSVARALWLLPSAEWRETVTRLAVDPDPGVGSAGRMALSALDPS